jgi:ABC-type transport system involved in multi-copper enzyme maturation permease subunit
MRLFGLIALTFRETFVKKTFMGFMGISTLITLLFIFALNLDIVDGATTYVSLFGNEVSVDENFQITDLLFGFQRGLSIFLFTVGLFFALFATSGMITSMMQPGTIDILISKPLQRWQILGGRIIGVTGVVAANVAYLILATWLVLSFKTGIWNFGYLSAFLMIIATYFAFYAYTVLFSVLSGSTAFSLMLTYAIFFFSIVLAGRDKIYALLSEPIWGYVLDGLYYLFPRVPEISIITQDLVRGATDLNYNPLLSTMVFSAIILLLSAYLFQKKNF